MGANLFSHGMELGDLATWVSAAGSIGAAWAAVFAARKAVFIARMPLEAEKRRRREVARIIATALLAEVIQANREVLQYVAALQDGIEKNSKEPVVTYFKLPFLALTNMMERFVDKLDVFEHDDGVAIANSITAVINIRSVASVAHRVLDAASLDELGSVGIETFDVYMEECLKTSEILERANDSLIRTIERADHENRMGS